LKIPYFKHLKNLISRVIYGGLKPMVHKHKGIGGFRIIYLPINYYAAGFPQGKSFHHQASHCPVALGDKGVLG
jgi:hypothetical protein